MAGRGKMVYVPPVIIEEVESIREEHDLEVGVEAYKKMARYCRAGRELEKMRDPSIFDRPKRKTKKNARGWPFE